MSANQQNLADIRDPSHTSSDLVIHDLYWADARNVQLQSVSLFRFSKAISRQTGDWISASECAGHVHARKK